MYSVWLQTYKAEKNNKKQTKENHNDTIGKHISGRSSHSFKSPQIIARGLTLLETSYATSCNVLTFAVILLYHCERNLCFTHKVQNRTIV